MKHIIHILIAAFAASLLASCAALAQARPPHLTGNLVRDIENANEQTREAVTGKSASQSLESLIAKPFNDLANFVASDAAGAATLATQVPDLQDTNGRACWLKMQNAGAVFKAHPVPATFKIMTDFEALRLLQMTANDLCSYTPCTVVFSDGANLATSVAAAVGGALTSSVTLPSLTTLCSRIPQLSPMLPQAVTGALPPSTPAATPSPTPSPSATP